MKKMNVVPWRWNIPLWKKTFRVMKLTCLMVLLAVMGTVARGVSQNRQFNIQLKDATLKTLFNEIEEQSDFRFAFNNIADELKQTVTVNLQEATIDEVLKQALTNKGLEFSVMNGYVVVEREAKASATAQQKKNIVRGTILDEKGEPLVGVTIFVKGTTIGAVTNFDGHFSIDIPVGKTVQFSYIGYIPQEVKIEESTRVLNITLKESVKDLDEVAVYGALGLKINEEAQASAMTVLRNEQIVESRDPNVITSIKGLVPGLEIAESGTPMGSTKIVLRGNNSITGDNEALIVVDGVPYNNPSIRSAAAMKDETRDLGSGLDDIDPNSIASMTVLQGANAAALYGSRAANGAIIITTKKGTKQKGFGVRLSSTMTWEEAYVFPELQNVYGHGYDRKRVGEWHSIGEDGIPQVRPDRYGSWGPKMEGQEYRLMWRREQPIRTFDPQPNNVEDFFQIGKNYYNNLTLSNASDKGTYFLTFTSRNYEPIIENSSQDKYSITSRVTHDFTDELKLDTKLSYSTEISDNRGALGRSRQAFLGLTTAPRSFRLADIRDYKYGPSDVQGADWEKYRMLDGYPVAFSTSDMDGNPYWNVYEAHNEDKKTRITGMVKLSYDITDWLKAHVKYTWDDINSSSYNLQPKYSRSYMWDGGVAENQSKYNTRDLSALITARGNITDDLSYTANFGGNRYHEEYQSIGANGFGFHSEGNYIIQNSISKNVSQGYSEKAINALYGTFDLSYKDYLFFNVTGRNDWSSTLNPENRSFFYPSVGSSFVFTKALDLPKDIISFGKIRASWAEVGNATRPYVIHSYYMTSWDAHGKTIVQLQDNLSNYYLKPETTRSWEFGTDLQFFKNRLNVNFTYYHATTLDQILTHSPVSTTTGYKSRGINGGEVVNEGIEGRISVKPIKTRNFSWDIDFNFAKNNSEIKKLAEGVDQQVLGTIWNGNGYISATPGQSYGAIYGFTYKRNDEGKVIVSGDGIPLTDKTEQVYLGNAVRDWGGGVNNRFRYKNFSLKVLVDFSVGGKIASISEGEMNYKGTTKETLEGRAEWMAAREKHKELGESVPTGGSPYGGLDRWVGKSVFEDGTPNEGENAIYANPYAYYREMRSKKNIEEILVDADYVKLREVNLSYKLPKSLIGNSFIRSAQISFIGRNLLLLHQGPDHFDPDRYLQSNRNGAIGVETGMWPSTRTYAISLNMKF
ncbi:SusC/RagA family TonB-linked outer membrane protein [Prolixibacteraceae bacterium JC049]|nr:SusC/RagA family TonB-linked outer membrane protein [Prolixibacteraceae bacterium JC049]